MHPWCRRPHGQPYGVGHDPAVSSPHHTFSDAGPIGGVPVLVPGEVSLGHHGVRCPEAQPACR
jgi:magnesium chelatase family protein